MMAAARLPAGRKEARPFGEVLDHSRISGLVQPVNSAAAVDDSISDVGVIG